MSPDQSPPKPCFAPWMRHVDPVLAAEDSNALFDAFSTWREHLFARRKWLPLRRFLAFNAWAILLYPSLFIVPPILIYSRDLAIGAGALIVVTSILLYLVLRRQPKTNSIPVYFDECASIHGHYAPLHTDMWLAGANGRDVLGLLYLDARARAWRSCKSGFLFLLAIFLVLRFLIGWTSYYHSSSGLMRVTDIRWWVFTFACCWTLWEVCRFVWVWNIGTQGKVLLGFTLNEWRGMDGAALKSYVKTGIIVNFGWIPVFFLLVVYTLAPWEIMREMVMRGFPQDRMDLIAPWVISSQIVLTGLVLRLISRPLARFFSRRVEASLGKADDAYQMYIQRLSEGEKKNEPCA